MSGEDHFSHCDVFDAHQIVCYVVEHRIGRSDAEVAVLLLLLLLIVAVGILALVLLPESPPPVEVGDDLGEAGIAFYMLSL